MVSNIPYFSYLLLFLEIVLMCKQVLNKGKKKYFDILVYF